MSDIEKKLLPHFSGLLQQSEKELLQSLAEQAEKGITPANPRESEVTDFKDLAANQAGQSLLDTKVARLQEQIGEVRDALRRIEQGTYGECLECGDAIDVARLSALPFASLCTGCQSAFEKHHPKPSPQSLSSVHAY